MGWLTDLMRESPALDVARERLALAQEKYDAVYAENDILKRQLADAEADMAALKSRLAELEGKPPGALEPVEEDILKLLGQGDGRELTVSQIATHLGINKTKADYHVVKLCDDDYLGFPLIMGGGEPEIYVQQRGREYLVKNDLI